MPADHLHHAIDEVSAIRYSVEALRRTLRDDALSCQDRLYLSRCFDLLEMELTAISDCLVAVTGELPAASREVSAER